MKPLEKIVFIISNISIGGAQRVTLTLCRWFIKRGFNVKIIAVSTSSGNYVIPDNIEVEFLYHSSNLKVFHTIGRLKKYLQKERPQLVITMGVAPCLFSVPAVKSVKGIKHIISERNDPRHFLGKGIVKQLSRLMMKSGDGFVFQTEDAKIYYSKALSGRGIVIPNPILAENIPDAIHTEKKNYIVTMGRLTKQKNHNLLINAFDLFANSHPEYELHIYGSGELEEETKKFAKTKKTKYTIIFFAACNDVLERIKDAKIFVLSSDFEGMPNALIEAMAMGLPCISTDCPCGGPKFLIKNEKNGLLVPVGDVKSMTEAMNRLARSQVYRDQIGQEASKIRSRLSVEQISEMWIEYCEEIFNDK